MQNKALSTVSCCVFPLLLILCSCATAPQKPNAEAATVVLSPVEIGDLKEGHQPLCRITDFGLPFKKYGLMVQEVSFLNLRDNKTGHIVVESVPDIVREKFIGNDFYLAIPLDQIESKVYESLDRSKRAGLEFSDACIIYIIEAAFRKSAN